MVEFLIFVELGVDVVVYLYKCIYIVVKVIFLISVWFLGEGFFFVV